MTAPETLHRTLPRPRWPWWLAASQLLVLALWWRFGWRVGLPAMLLSHAAFIVPVFLPGARLYAPVLRRLPGAARGVWLTIDDGPSDDTLAMLDLLEAHDARATFFLVGERAARRPDLVREILRRGHDIGNHSHTHPQAWFWALGPRRMRDEVLRAQAALTALCGQPPRWFRSVVGMTNPFVTAPLRAAGLTRVAWNARGYDAVRADPESVVARIERELAPGAIVLLHEGAPHGRSIEVVARLLARLDVLGYRTVLPEELLALQPGAAADSGAAVSADATALVAER